MTADVLSLVEVTKRYKEASAVERVSLGVHEAEFLALLGPSGAGKSTTLRLIAGLERPDRGDIMIRGRSVASVPAYQRDIGVVFQHYALFPHMSVEDNVAFPLRMRRAGRAEATRRVRGALELVHLQGFEHRKPSELSGGQQQRVALARALVFEPSLLLMDEPLAALDKKLREQLRSEIKAIQDRLGVTVVYVTHDQEEALSLADRIAVMRSGRIEQVGSPREMYESPATVFVAGFVGEGNFFSCVIDEVSGNHIGVSTKEGVRLRGVARDLHSLQRGESATYLVRPERLRLKAAGQPANGDNRLDGRIERSFYFGQTTTYRVRMHNTHALLKAMVPAEVRAGGLQIGDQVTAEWDWEDGIVVAGESPATMKEIAGVE